MRKPTPRMALLMGAGLAAGSLVSAALAVASIPSSNGSITSCYKKTTGSGSPSMSSSSSGTLRVIDPGTGQSCRNSETQLTWNQQGVPGATGAPGPAGPQGAPGMSNHNISTAAPFTMGANGAVATLFATCLPGQVAVGGGMTTVGSSTLTVDVLDDGPDSSGTAWRLRVINRNLGIAGIGQVTIAAQAVCVDSL